MEKQKGKIITVVVSGNQVASIYGFGDVSDVAVEVIDLDRPEFETPEEEAMFDDLEKQVDSMKNDPEWKSLW